MSIYTYTLITLKSCIRQASIYDGNANGVNTDDGTFPLDRYWGGVEYCRKHMSVNVSTLAAKSMT